MQLLSGGNEGIFLLLLPFPNALQKLAPELAPVNFLFAKQTLVLDIHGLCLLKAVAVQTTCQTPPAVSPVVGNRLAAASLHPQISLWAPMGEQEAGKGKGMRLLQHFTWANS